MKKVKASSLVELVIALSVISICLVVASRVFVQNSKSSIKFKDVKSQSEFQSFVFEALRSDTLLEVKDWMNDEEAEIKKEDIDRSKVFRKVYYLEIEDKKLWQQEFGFE